MPERPLISVIMPVWNTKRYLREAIESILEQAWTPLEVFIVDDGSSDGSPDLASCFQPRVRVLRQPHSGTAAARNRGVQASTGEYLAFLDADDRWASGRLALQFGAFAECDDLDIVTGMVRSFFSPDLPEEARRRIRLPKDPIPGTFSGAMLIRRTAFFRIGLFQEEWDVGVDMEWFTRLVESDLSMKVLPEIVLHRRIHDRNTGLVRKHFVSQRLQILKRFLDRKRGRRPPQAGERT
jgi:glycosyltransferase involved in cell wall biosynthesis